MVWLMAAGAVAALVWASYRLGRTSYAKEIDAAHAKAAGEMLEIAAGAPASRGDVLDRMRKAGM